MMTRTARIRLSRLAAEAGDYVDQVPALVPGSAAPVIVERTGRGVCLVDGFHRAAGMLRWCRERGMRPERQLVTVVISGCSRLTALAAEPGPRQEKAIEALYRRAGI
jgi:hypothetical protein